MAHGLDRYLAAGDAGIDRRLHPGISPVVVALRRAGDSRFACRLAHDHDADLGAVSVSAAAGPSSGFFGAAAVGDHGADRRAKEDSRAQRLQYRQWQGRTETDDSFGLGPRSRAVFRVRHSLAFGFPAVLDLTEGGSFQGLGDAFNLG